MDSSSGRQEQGGNEREGNYGDGAAYWNQRFTDEPFVREWLLDWQDFADLFGKYVDKDPPSRILHAGCGSSVLGEDMYDAGYQDITNVDSSDVAIELKKANQAGRNMRWLCMDAAEMTFPDQSFDVVIDKGLLAALRCGTASTVSKHIRLSAHLYLKEVIRLLKPGGTFFLVCLAPREALLTSPPWAFRILETREQCRSFIHVCQKTELSDAAIARWPQIFQAFSAGVTEEELATLEADGTWVAAQELQAADVVQVENEFVSGDSPTEQVRLTKGLRGIVKVVDADGDAVITFPTLAGVDSADRFVMYDQLENLAVRRPLATP